MAESENRTFQDLKRSRSAHCAQLTKLYKDLEQYMISHENDELVESLYAKLCDRFNIFKSVHLECLDLCEESTDCENLEETYERYHNNFKEFQERYEQWKFPDQCNEDDEICSNVSSTCKTKLASSKAKRLIAEQKLNSLKKKHELERARREIEIQERELEYQCEIEQARLEESVWHEALVEETGEHVQDLSYVKQTTINNVTSGHERTDKSAGTMHDDCEIINAPNSAQIFTKQRTNGSVNQNAHSSRKQPSVLRNTDTSDLRNTDTSVESAFQLLANTLQEGFNLPKPELLRFSGSTLEYCKFVNNFETNIECRVRDDRLRLSYLIQYCDGEAKSAIEDCVLLSPSEGYKQARDILYSRYGRPHNIARSYVDKLVNGHPIKASDTDGLSDLALEMRKCEITLSQLGFDSDINNTDNLRRIVRRLPMHVRGKWVDIAHSINESGREPLFSDLVKFVEEKARVATSLYGLDLANEKGRGKSVEGRTFKSNSNPRNRKNSVATFTTNSEVNSPKYKPSRKCYCCLGSCVDLASCTKFRAMILNDREQFVKKNKLCFNCLKGKHFSNVCRKPAGCNVTECKSKHHFLLHSWVDTSKSDHTEQQSVVNCATTGGSCIKNCLGIIPVLVRGESGTYCKTYALLDEGADKTLCDERLLKTLNLPSKPVTFQMSTASSSGITVQGQEVELHVQPVFGGNDVTLRKVWSVKSLPVSTRSAARNADIRDIPYLSKIEIPEIDSSSVMLLIGTDAPQAHIPLEVRSGRHDQPYAIRTLLGWAVRGPVTDATTQKMANVNFQQSADMLLQQQLEKMWSTDFDDKVKVERNSMSLEDKKASNIMSSSLRYENGHYKLKLPWRDDKTIMPNNITLAHARLDHLKKKLARDHELHKMYSATVTDYIQKGHAREVANIESGSNRVWYLPHHPVINPNKPGKVRVVFDCAAKFKGISLNSQLLQGPDFMNSLVGVLIRFRQDPVAIAADIEAMFHQVRVDDEDCEALRFLWWPGGDITQQPRCYQMLVHLFGATSSPSCTAYALKRTASDNAHLYRPHVVNTVERNFYVDDCLKSVSSDEKAIELAADLQSLLRRGGFRLTKWLSNKRDVVESIPESERAPSIMNLSKSDSLPVDRALGVHWDVEKDEFKFKVKLRENPITRRGILSTVSSIFDPLGLVAPVTLRAKAIVQNLCRQKLSWDNPIPEKDASEWRQWLETLPYLENVFVRRCFKLQHFSSIKNAQLHVFCDGSQLGYGACVYLRLQDDKNVISCSLVIGKSRLAPLKQTSIPRLELSGAVVASRLYALVADELEIKIDNVTFWTDSMIVLGYIKNETRRFKTFVGNRVSEIHELTSKDQWRYVDTSSNPADIASRGMHASDFKTMEFWLHGPDFMQKDESHWPSQPTLPDVREDDSEAKKEVAINTTIAVESLQNIIDRYSNWTKLRRTIAWLLRYKTYCRRRYLKHTLKQNEGDLSLDELNMAEHSVLAFVQSMSFMDERIRLQNIEPVRKDSCLASLNPIIHHDLIRIQGRLQSEHPSKYPIVLPSKHNVTELIIRHIHEHNGHVGKEHVLSISRQKYWILHGPSAVKQIVRNCIVCKRQHTPLMTQQMAPLLDEQTTPDLPPFSFIGIDYFGPLFVKASRAREKRYGCIFTCLTSRAVHFEVTHSLSTDSFISAFQRFQSGRGRPQKVFSDNGTNLVGGEDELRKSLQLWNQSKLNKYFTQNDTEWHFNPPNASHMGGSWERLIRSTRVILKSLIKGQLLSDEQLLTLMAETEKILNDRPLTPVSSDPRDPPALTPNMLLLMKSNQCLPVSVFKKQDVYAKRWWRQIQYLANVFWKRWLKEYLPLLQKRQKWQRKTVNLKKNDVVLVAVDNVPRGQWPLARVVDVNLSRDGLVRSCVIRTKSGQLIRPVTKLCLLEASV